MAHCAAVSCGGSTGCPLATLIASTLVEIFPAPVATTNENSPWSAAGGTVVLADGADPFPDADPAVASDPVVDGDPLVDGECDCTGVDVTRTGGAEATGVRDAVRSELLAVEAAAAISAAAAATTATSRLRVVTTTT